MLVAAALLWIFRPGDRDAARVEYRDPSTWLTSAATGELVQVNGATGDVSARVEVGEPGQSLSSAALSRGAVALSLDSSAASLVDGVALEVAETIELAGGRASIIAGPSHGFLIQGTSVSTLDLGAGVTATAEVEEELQGTSVADDGALWGVGVRSGDLYRIEGDAFERFDGLGRRDEALSTLTVGGRPYLVDRRDAVIKRVRPTGGLGTATCLVSEVATATPAGGSDETSSALHVVVADPERGRIQVAYLDEGRCASVDVANNGADLGAPVVVDGFAYVPDFTERQVVVVDLGERAVVRRLSVDQITSFELFARSGTVWLNDPTGSLAAVVSADGFRVISKFTVAALGTLGVTGDGVDAGVDNSGGNDVATGANGGSGQGDAEGGSGTDGESGNSGAEGSAVTDGDRPVLSRDDDPVTDAPIAEIDDVIQDRSQIIVPENTIPATSLVPVDSNPTDGPVELNADFTFSSAVVSVGESVTFNDTSTGNPTSWTWLLGDGRTLTGPTITTSWPTEGLFVVTLIVDRDEETSQQSVGIQVLSDDIPVPPRANFVFSGDPVEVGTAVVFSDTSTGDPTSWAWDFGDGATATGPTATHRFEVAGSYTVSLRVANNDGANSKSAVIRVLSQVDAPTAVIDAPSSATVGQPVVLNSASTGNPTSLTWDFGDGVQLAGSQVRHTYDAPGTYEVSLTAANSAGSSTATWSLLVNEPALAPVARFQQSHESVTAGQAVSFTSTSLNSPDSIVWDFGDGAGAQGAVVDHVFETAGTFTVTLAVSNKIGRDTAISTVVVAPGGSVPEAAFVFGPSAPIAGTLVRFSDQSTNGPTTWAWDFGDGSTSNEANPGHAYAAVGNYRVRLTVSNDAGTNTTKQTVRVIGPLPTASFNVSSTSPDVDETVSFTDTSANGPATWAWNFGDGSTSTAQSPSHAYRMAGVYTASLTVTNSSGSDTFEVTIAVAPPAPVAQFTFNPGAPRQLETVQFADSSSNTPAEWFWDFGDGATSSEQNPQHAFAAGEYDVSLTVSNQGGSDSFVRTIVVAAVPDAPVAVINVSPGTVVAEGTRVFFEEASTNNPDSRVWTLWDGRRVVTRNLEIRFRTPGTFRIRLDSTNEGGTGSTFIDIIVNPAAPSADFQVAAVNNLTASFVDASDGAVASWFWNFGDGSTSTEANPTHAYAAGGTYQVQLTVSNASGQDTRSRNVTVSVPSPIAGFTFAASGLDVTFQNTSSGSIDSYAWDFGDGTGSAEANPSHTYAAAGEYRVRLVVVGPGGNDQQSVRFTVTAPPVTDPPVTDPPVTDPPVTDPPVTDPPVTDPPVTDPPVTDPPVTDPPVTDPPVTDPPVTDPPVTDPPITDPPTTLAVVSKE